MDDESDRRLLEKIQQYHNSILKHSELKNDSKILAYIKKLYDMPVTVEHLKETGIGRTMNALRKYNGHVGIASKAIVSKWKQMVAQEEDTEYQEQPSSPPIEQQSSPPIEPDSPTDRPPSPVEEKVQSQSSADRYSKYENYKKESTERSSRSENPKREERHHKEEKRDSHKSSHSKEKDHKNRRDDSSHKHKKDEKTHHENKRKRIEEEQSSSKRVKYEAHSSESEEQSDENMAPDSTTRENSPVEKKSSSNHKKHHKSDKSEKHRHDKDRKEINGSHSSKKSSHKDKESKHASDSSKKEKSSKEKYSRSSSSSKSPEKSKKIKIDDDNGIDSGSGASFAEALGMMEPTKPKTTFKKKSSHSASPTPSTSTNKSLKSTPNTSNTPKPRTQSPLTQSPNLLSPHAKLEPLDNNIVSQLPEITTNYKPNSNNYDSPFSNVKNMSEEEALCVVIASKSQRTKVYSGVKTNWGYVPTLFNLCVRVLQDNIDALEYTGGVPYVILKPVLERATANQLLNAEYFNPYLIEESDELWESHCKRECKGMKRQEMESWRDMYLRCRDERDAKLKALTVNIKQSIDKSLPVRQTKLAYVDSVVKPPRGVARKQAKYGTSENLKKPLITPTQRLNSIAAGSSGEKISVPNPGPRAVSSSSSSSSIKPKKAPLMQKTLALMKGRFGRR